MANDGDSGRITRSGRDTLSKKKMIPSPSSARKSERLEKRTQPTLAVTRKSERVGKQKMTPSPLRRSERTRNLSSSDPSGSGSNSKSTGSSGSKKKQQQQPKKRKSVKQLTFEAKEVSDSENEEHDVGTSSPVKAKRMDARTYRAVFKKTNKDCHEDSNRMDKSTQEGGNNGGGNIDECFKGSHLDCKEVSKDGILPSEDAKAKEMRADSSLSGPVKELSETNVTLGSLVPSNATTHESGGNNGGCKIGECFKGSPLDCKEVSKDGNLPSEDSKAKQMRADSRLSGPVKELLENNVTLGSLVPSNATTHATGGAPERVQSDCCGEETSQMLVSRNSMLNENLIRNCVGHDKGEKLTSSKRKGIMVDMHSDVSATLVNDDNCNLIADAGPSRLCGNTPGTSGSCSKRIRRISLSDMSRDGREVINNVDQPSKSEGEKLSTGNKEGKSGDPVDRPRGNYVESEIRKLHDEQRSLHLLLKPEIAKLCAILLFPDNVKSMVDNCLEYIMNNHQIHREPLSILQAFQLSLCWIAAALLKHKLDPKASLMLAKQHLNFFCKIKVVHEIFFELWELKENFLYHSGNPNVTGSPKASESSNRVYSYPGAASEVELANKRSIKEIPSKFQNQLRKLILMQQEEKQKLKADIENEKAEFERRYKIESAFIRSCVPNDVMRTEKLKVFNGQYDKRIGEMKLQHEKRLKDLEVRQLVARLKFQKSWEQDKSLNIVASKELGTRAKYLQTCDQAQPHNGPKNVILGSDDVAEGKSSENIVEAMTRTGTGVGLYVFPDANSPVAASCSSPVELQTPLVTQAGANEMDIMPSGDEPVSRNEGHNIAENESDSQGNIISKHSNPREQCFDGATSMADEGEGCEKFSLESHNGCGRDTVTSVLPSNGEICGGETSDVPSGEVAPVVHKTSSSNDGQHEVPSCRQGKNDGSMLSKSICGFSVEVKANGVSDGVKNMASLNSQPPEEHIASVTAMSLSNCENAAQIHEADDSNDPNNADTLNSPLSDERIASLNSKSRQEHVHSVIAMCMPNCENPAENHEADNGNGSNNAVTLNSPSSDERIADGAIVSILDREVHEGMSGTVNITHFPENVTAMNPHSSMEQISGGAVNVSVLDRELSRPCGTASPRNQPSLEQQNPDGDSSSIPAGQIPVEVPETSHEGVTVSRLDREAPVGMSGTVNCTDYPENVTLNSSSMDQTSDRGSVNVSVLDRVLSSRHCGASSPSDGPATIFLLNPPLEQQIPDRVSLSIPDGQIPVIVPEISHEVAECHNDRENLPVSMLVNKSTTSDQQEGVHRTMTENTSSQETPVPRPVDLMEPLEQVQLLSSVESPPDQDTAREMQNSLVSSPFDTVTASQPNHVSLVMEPPEQVQQLASAEFLSSNHDPSNLPLTTEIELQPTNEDAFSNHVREASIEVPNQAVVQPTSNLELGSRSHQVVVRPASNMDLDSLMPGGVRTRSPDTRNLSTPLEINNHPIQTATQSASRIVPPLCPDPLKHELERIHKLIEQNMKNHEDMKLQLKSDFEKELEELRRKYDIKFQEIEVEFQQTKKNLDTSLNIVLVNKILAEAFRSKCMDLKILGASGKQQDASFAQQLFQLSRQQSAIWPALSAGSSSCGPPAASLQSSSTTASSQTMVPAIQAGYNTSGIFSGVSARLPHINLISSPSGNLQAGGEIRAPAPHLQPYRPSISLPASSLPTVAHGMPSYPAASNVPATSPSFSHRLPQLTPTTYQSDPRRGHWPESAGGLPTPNLSAVDLRMDANSQSGINLSNILSRMSNLTSFNLSKFGTSSSMATNSPHQNTTSDVLCLSDDD